jgi:hypothetical protein
MLQESHKNMDDDADLEAEIEQEMEREEQIRVLRNAEAVQRRRLLLEVISMISIIHGTRFDELLCTSHKMPTSTSRSQKIFHLVP